MKRIDAVVRREQFGKVKLALEAIACPGMMVFTFRGHGKQGGLTETYRGRKFKVDLLPKVLLTIFANDDWAYILRCYSSEDRDSAERPLFRRVRETWRFLPGPREPSAS